MTRLSMSMFASKVDYDAAVAAQSAANQEGKYLNHDQYLQAVTSGVATKPVVHYRKANGVFGLPVVRESCDVYPVDHPAVYLNGKIAHTSSVVSVDENGVDFETLNTRYVLVD